MYRDRGSISLCKTRDKNTWKMKKRRNNEVKKKHFIFYILLRRKTTEKPIESCASIYFIVFVASRYHLT